LPGGDRYYSNGLFVSLGAGGYYWNRSASDATTAWQRGFGYTNVGVYRNNYSKQYGFSVRCLKGAPTLMPTLTSTAVSPITQTTATSGGNITSEGGATVTARGVVWGTTTNPTTGSNLGITTDGSGTGSFTSNLTGLTAGTTYYVRAYATNSVGTSYGNEVSFTTGSTIPTNGLVAYYPFNGNANDESGNSLNGIAKGATLTADRKGNPNKAYSFNGVDNWIEIADNVLLRPQQITIAGWINLNVLEDASIFYKGEYEVYSMSSLSFSIKQNSGCMSYIGNGWQGLTITNPQQLNQWYFVVGTFDGTTMSFYRDGVLISQKTGLPATNIDNCAGNTFRIGRFHDLSSYFFNGKIDDIRVYNRALTATEIQALYNE